MRIISHQNMHSIIDALEKISTSYSGALSGLSVLKRAAGISEPPSDPESLNPLIPLPDTGMLRRFTVDSRHPKHLAQPTDTSLRESRALLPGDNWTSSESQRVSGLILGADYFNDLLQGYTFDDVSFISEDMLDLTRFLNAT